MKKITVAAKLFVNFKKYLPKDAIEGKAIISLDEGSTLEDLLNILTIPTDEPKMILINGLSQGVFTKVNPTPLKEGDTIVLFPPAGGG
ncbi:MAG TPA: MoaD/ThiS family protein [Thermodesulfobacteriota bacterium]|nr:MoaD/ThiS family protein [Thermodesulfobacteriota bacterium]